MSSIGMPELDSSDTKPTLTVPAPELSPLGDQAGKYRSHSRLALSLPAPWLLVSSLGQLALQSYYRAAMTMLGSATEALRMDYVPVRTDLSVGML